MFSPGGCGLLHKCFRVLRLSYSEFSNLPDLKKLTVVRTVDKVIDKSTNLFIESPIHVKIKPIDVNNIDSHNKLSMQLYSLGKDTSDFTVKQTSKRLELINKNQTADRNDVCLIQVPLQLKVHITTSNDASVHISKMQGEEFVIRTQKGNINISDIQAKEIRIESDEGAIKAEGRLQASTIELKTGIGSAIDCNNIMSNNFVVTTHAGPITVKSCYSDQSHFVTAMGDISLDHMHRFCIIDIIQQGNLHISGFEGKLQASLKSGNVFMHAAKLTDKSSIFIHEKGKVEVRISEFIKTLTAINLIADKIDVEEEIKKLGLFMDDSHPQRFRYPNVEGKNQNELLVECRNGLIELKQTNLPFLLK